MAEVPDGINKDIKTDLGYLIEVSENLIKKTDDYYSVVHETLPEIEKNIDLTNQEVEILIEYFVDSKDIKDLYSSDLDSFFVSRVLKAIKDDFEKVSELLLDKSDIEEILSSFSAIKEGEKTSFDNFLELLKEMESILLKVKEISYNSIIFSARIGAEGKGFNVISDNLRQTSGILEKNISSINGFTDDLIGWQSDFKQKINDITEKRERAVKSHGDELDEKLITILKSMKSISELLRDLIKNVKTTTEPFQELMVFIQRQDIIRQNLENLIKCLQVVEGKYDEFERHIEEAEDEPDKSRILDLVVFLDSGMQLVLQLGENVKAQLEESLGDISETSGNLVYDLSEIRDDSAQLAEFLASDESVISLGSGQTGRTNSSEKEEELSAVGYTFKELTESMDEFVNLLKEVKNDVDELKEQKNSFDISISNLNQGLEKVYKQVNFLKKVKLLSNIEVSRLDEQGKLVGERIDSIVDLIQGKVNDNKEAFDKLKTDLDKDLSKFDELVVENQGAINDSLGDVENSAKKLKTAQETISSAVVTLSQEIENLYKKIEIINDELKSSENIYRYTEMLIRYSKDVAKKAENEKKRIMSFYKVNSWEKSDNDLVSFFEQFTTYVERAKAKQFMSSGAKSETQETQDSYEDDDISFDLDTGSEEGELTLF